LNLFTTLKTKQNEKDELNISNGIIDDRNV
jgi:hypothetical protein